MKRQRPTPRGKPHEAPDGAAPAPPRLRAFIVVDVVARDPDGELIARPVIWDAPSPPPDIALTLTGKGPPVALGDRALVRILSQSTLHAAVIRVLPRKRQRIIGVYRHSGEEGGWIKPIDRRDAQEYRVDSKDAACQDHGAASGDLVQAELSGGGRSAAILKRLGAATDPQAISLIALLEHDIPVTFQDEALAQAKAASAPVMAGRVDLRDVPLVTIDGADARDFDDAVFAEPDPDPANPGGWHLVVAIADVACYVPAGSALDHDAYERGNSVYFPDRVVPMLPEALSNGWCSLKPAEERACLAVHIWITRDGVRLRHGFVRAMMRSRARLTYDAVQTAYDASDPALSPLIQPLYGAFAALDRERSQRGALDLDLPERQIFLNAAGEVEAIAPRARLDSHRLIETFMILANVCAAISLEAVHTACLYRIHDAPSPEKLQILREFLTSLHLPAITGQTVHPRLFMKLLDRTKGTANETLIQEMVLRSQAQALYHPDNIGHFGLALARYTHFTSPIRRYADLCVHRCLIAALHLGEDGATPPMATLTTMAAQVSSAERRAVQAEREVVERYIAAFMAAQTGAIFEGRITGVTHFGLFVRLVTQGAEGLLPVRALPRDFYHFDSSAQRLTADRNGQIFTLGDRIMVQLVAADPLSGSLTFTYVTEAGVPLALDTAQPPPRRGGRRSPLGKPAGKKPRGRHKRR